MLIIFNLVYAMIAGPAGALSDRVGRKRMLVAGWVFYSLVYFGFAKASEGWHAWGLMAAYGLYYDLTEGVAKALLPIWWILSAAVPPMVSIMPQWELQHFPPV